MLPDLWFWKENFKKYPTDILHAAAVEQERVPECATSDTLEKPSHCSLRTTGRRCKAAKGIRM